MISQHINILTANTLLVLFWPSAVGGGELISGDNSDGPFPGASNGVLGQGDVSPLGREKKSAGERSGEFEW
jgi:hypothetical protein